MYELKVEGMTCGHCVKAVTDSVKALDQQAQVEVNLEQKKVRIDTRADINAVIAAINEAGYVTAADAV